MNIRKPVDYSAMYRELTEILARNLPQMDEIYAVGKVVNQRPEKGAAVAAAEFLQASFPDRTGFSPRNVRRMRDFYKVYENDEPLLRLAMKLGWTLNVVIMEAELARDERKWYLEQALCRGWSKMQLLNAIRSGVDSTEHLEQFDSSEKQVNQVAVENPVFIVEVMRDIHTNDDFFEKILGKQQRIKLRRSLLLRYDFHIKIASELFRASDAISILYYLLELVTAARRQLSICNQLKRQKPQIFKQNLESKQNQHRTA